MSQKFYPKYVDRIVNMSKGFRINKTRAAVSKDFFKVFFALKSSSEFAFVEC